MELSASVLLRHWRHSNSFTVSLIVVFGRCGCSYLCKCVSEMPFTFMHEKYADIYFVYGFYNGDVRAAVAEHQQRFYYILDFHIETSCIIHIYMFESD